MALHIKESWCYEVNGKIVDVDITAEAGKITLLCGPNGIGKTTFFTHLKLNQNLLGEGVAAFMDQRPFHPLANLTVKEAFGVLEQELANARPWHEVEEIKRLGVESLLERPVSQLSGGENQKVKLAMALLRPFDILLADEPLQSLDEESQKLFLSLFEDFALKAKTLVLIEHNQDRYSSLRPDVANFKNVGEKIEVRNG